MLGFLPPVVRGALSLLVLTINTLFWCLLLFVLALCKATAVQVSALQADLPQSSIQNLPGKAVRVSRGATGDEVSMLLDSGLQLVGFAPPGSGLKAKARVNAVIDEAAVVIALAG